MFWYYYKYNTLVGKLTIKNKLYRKFLDEGIIQTLSPEDLDKALKRVTGKNTIAGRSLLIDLYYTGGRPVEVLEHKGKNIYKLGRYIVIKFEETKKKGVPRSIYLLYSNPHVKELYKYASSLMPEMFLFWAFKGKYKVKKGKKEYISTTDKLRYYFKIWFDFLGEDAINPYYLRHNRFSKVSEAGATPTNIMLMKGAKSLDSVRPYLHMSTHEAKKMARRIK